MSRVTEDPTITPDNVDGPRYIRSPILIVEGNGGGGYSLTLAPDQLDTTLTEPRLFGIMLSDLVDHIAAAYAQIVNRDERDIREALMKTMRDEDRFKQKDPSRGNMRGCTIKPRGN